jgi:hypothetical protein
MLGGAKHEHHCQRLGRIRTGGGGHSKISDEFEFKHLDLSNSVLMFILSPLLP